MVLPDRMFRVGVMSVLNLCRQIHRFHKLRIHHVHRLWSWCGPSLASPLSFFSLFAIVSEAELDPEDEQPISAAEAGFVEPFKKNWSPDVLFADFGLWHAEHQDQS